MLTEADYKAWAASLDVDEEVRNQLMLLTPESYIGLAVQLVDRVLNS
ncbi:MAG: hypothetical protein HND47_22045 [Chloroflexi bacterium]|nr:hypothetical protein [Chloroflexota bacterium]